MAKFCSNCGGQIPEGANNCPGCGKPVANNPVVSPVATAYQQPAGYPVPAKTNNTAKYIGIGAVVVVAIIVIVILFNLIKGIFGASYTKPIDNMFKGIEKQSWKTFSSALLPEEAEYIEDYMGYGYDNMDDFLKEMYDGFEDEYGKNIKISYKITDTEKLDNGDMKDLEEDFDANYDEKIDIKEAYQLEVEATIRGNDDSSTDSSDMIVVKVGSNWYMYDFYGIY